MCQQQNLTTVKEIYAAVGGGDLDAILDRVTDDVDLAAEAAGAAAPWHGPRTGKDGVVHLLVDWAFRSIATGREASMTMHHYWRLRDGKVECFRGSEDTELTTQALAA